MSSPDEPFYTWRSAAVILLWIIVLVTVCAVMVVTFWAVLDYIFTNVPEPYIDPEPPPPTLQGVVPG